MTIELPVPALINNRQLATETNPKALKAWLVSLPPSNLLETGRAIYDALTTLNRTRVDADERIKLLEHYQVSIDMLDAPLEAVYGSATLPVRDKAKQVGLLARNLQLELLNGYKLLLNERANARFSMGQKHVPGHIQRLYLSYHKLMWVCCKGYAPVPPGVWSEVHTLFRYVIQHKLIDAPSNVSAISTIGGLYKQMLLLFLVDPYRYSPQDLDKIQDLIRSYGMAAQFQPLGVAANPAGFFMVRMDEDAPPAFLGQRPIDVVPQTTILLDTIDLAKILHKAQNTVEQKLPNATDKPKALAWLDLLRQVTRQWSIAPKRVFQRMRANSRVQVTGGLRTATYYLNGGKPLLQPISLDMDLSPDSDEIAVHDTPTHHAQHVRERYSAPDEWVVLNESAGGYALRLAPIPQHGLYRIGDIVGLRPTHSESWMIGAIRWVQTVDNAEALEIGVQIITASGQAAMVKPTIAHPGDTFQPSLLLPEVTALKQAAMIAAPHGTYSPQRELSVFTYDGEQLVRATRLHESTIGYDLFEYGLA